MKVSIVQTHIRGVRQSKDLLQVAETLVGDLIVEDCPPNLATTNRGMRVARLSEPAGSMQRQMVAPLFEVQLARISAHSMWLTGVQIASDETLTPVHFAQGWWVRIQDQG